MESSSLEQTSDLAEATLQNLSESAWNVRENASVLGTTKVGCALLTDEGLIFAGCNVEHPYRCHDIHAEINAIGSMVSGGGRMLKAILIVAERERFTPCGGCMDWIIHFASDECLVAWQSTPNGPIHRRKAKELMPLYPK